MKCQASVWYQGKLQVCLLSFALRSVSEEEMQMDCSRSSERKQSWSRSTAGVSEEPVNVTGRWSSLPLAAPQRTLQQPQRRSGLHG